MGACGIGYSVGTSIVVPVPCSTLGGRLYCYGAVLVLKMSANFSTAVLALGIYSKKCVTGIGLQIIVMKSRI